MLSAYSIVVSSLNQWLAEYVMCHFFWKFMLRYAAFSCTLIREGKNLHQVYQPILLWLPLIDHLYQLLQLFYFAIVQSELGTINI